MSIAANIAGGVVVFLFLVLALPVPRGVSHPTTLIVLNAVLFVTIGALGLPIGSVWIARLWRRRLAWAISGREPTEHERELTLRFPLTQQWVIGILWLVPAVLFAALNAPFSGELAGNVAIGIVLGGLVTIASGYLLAERILRPISALALAGGVSVRPQLPGVAARALLAWTLSAGTVLLGVALLGIGGLHESRFTRIRLSIVVLVLSVAGIAVG